jgi:hypothetical protein
MIYTVASTYLFGEFAKVDSWRQMVVVKEPPPKPLYTPTNELTIGDYTKYGKMSNEKSELV